MHNRVDVAFSIKADVEKKKPKKSTYGNSNARPQRAVSPPQLVKREDKIPPSSSPVEKRKDNKLNEQKNSPTHVPLSSSGPVPQVRRPATSGGTRKTNSENKAPYNMNSMICPDRDILRYEQDAEISKYYLTHKILDDSDVRYPNPHVTNLNERTVKKDKSVIRRERFVPNTCGTALNNSLQFHPHLKEMKQSEAEMKAHHAERWISATVLEDDPERCRPEKDKAKLLQSDFQREYKWTHTVVNDLKVLRDDY